MASHFQVPTERFSDNDLARGFSFDARQANTQGQFSGPTPKSIIPGVQSAIPPVSVLPVKSPTQRLTLPFPGPDFTSNAHPSTADLFVPVTGLHQAGDSAARNPSATSHFSTRGAHDEPEPEDATIPTGSTRDSPERSIVVDTQNRSPPFGRREKQALAPSAIGRQGRPSCGSNKGTSDAAESVVRNKDKHSSSRYLQRDYSESRTPPSRCGDLEGFGIYEASTATRTPPSHARITRRSQSRTGSFDIESSIPRRTHSRASNISRKRRFDPADHHGSEPDRKRLAMSEAVKHWNECIQITTEESDRARFTIQGLKKKVQKQANELQIAQDAVKSGDTGLRTLQKQYQDLQTRGIRALEDKKNLEVKFNELIVGHEKLRNQVKEMSTKFDSCEGRLGSAITEQRELFNQSKNFYVSLNNQMNQDEAVEKANADAVEKALQDSKQKREELKKVVEHIQRDFQYKKAEYERKIISLEKENESQCDQIDAIEEDKERLYNEMVSNRSTNACIERVDSRLSGFVTQLRALDASQDTAAIELRDVRIKVDDLPGSHDFAELKDRISGSHTKLSGLEKLIQERLLPAIESIASKQSESQVSANSLAVAVEDGLAKLQEQIQTHAIDFSKTIKANNKSHTEVLDLLTLISAANGDVASRVEVGNNRLESLVEGVSSNGTIGTCIKAILESTQTLSENSGKIVSSQGKAQDEVQRLQEVLAGQIDAKFQAQDRVSRELFTDLKESFESSLAVWKANLAPESARRANSSETALMNRKTIQDVEAMRSNLQQVESQLAKIEDVPLSLQKIYDLSVLIQETSKYMDREEQWVQQTMADRALHSDGSGTTDKSASQTSDSQSPESSSLGSGPGRQEGLGGTCTESQMRKVVVHSPKPQKDSPLPVTAAQEQRRRRESTRPRSILKQPQNKTMAVKGLVASVRSSFPTSAEVIADIRSTLIQSPISGSPSSHRTTGLTPMTEYLRLNKATSRRRDIVLGDLVDAELAPGLTVAVVGVAATV